MAKFTLTKDVVIPAGTTFDVAANERGGKGYVESVVGFGKDFSGNLVVQIHGDMLDSGFFNHHCSYSSSTLIGGPASCATFRCNVCGEEWEKDVS